MVIKAPKAKTAAECERLEQLPNIGPSLAAACWQRRQQLLDRQHRRGVGEMLVGRAGPPCDRAASAENDDGPGSALHFVQTG